MKNIALYTIQTNNALSNYINQIVYVHFNDYNYYLSSKVCSLDWESGYLLYPKFHVCLFRYGIYNDENLFPNLTSNEKVWLAFNPKETYLM